MRTNELIGPQLDWVVARCEGYGWFEIDSSGYLYSILNEERYTPSTDWEQGGPIIEREGINIRAIRKKGHRLDRQYFAAYDHGNTRTLVFWIRDPSHPMHYFSGPTMLVAAMRCYVTHRLGNEIDIPKELL